MRGTFEDDKDKIISFQKVVVTAIKRGWNPASLLGNFYDHYKDFKFEDTRLIVIADDDSEWEYSWRDILFRHDFAKAYFGERDIDYEVDRKIFGIAELFSDSSGCAAEYDGQKWQYHLEQSVLKNDPIGYYDATSECNEQKD